MYFHIFFFSSRRRHTRSVSAFLLNRSSDLGMKTEFSASYGGWDPNPDSEILNLLEKVYKEQTGEDVIVQVDHAGLECSIILGKYPHLDVVSLGPTIRSPHTATERFKIDTAQPFWDLLVKTLEEIPAK